MVLGECTHRLVTSGTSTGLTPVRDHMEPVADPVGITCNYMAGSRPALFPPLFFAPSLLDWRGHRVGTGGGLSGGRGQERGVKEFGDWSRGQLSLRLGSCAQAWMGVDHTHLD